MTVPVRNLLLALLFAAPTSAEGDLVAAVWTAADASEADYAAALAELRRHPAATWRRVHDILAAGREYLAEPAQPLVQDAAALNRAIKAAGFLRGKVTRLDFGADPGHWYTYDLPEGYDGETPLAVFLDLSTGDRPNAPSRQGWAFVRPPPPAWDVVLYWGSDRISVRCVVARPGGRAAPPAGCGQSCCRCRTRRA